MNISDKTGSKWERGLGCPDISLLSELSDLLEVDIGKLLSGDLSPNDFVGGNMKKTKYYVCPVCHNISLCTGEAEVLCCGRKIEQQQMQKAEENEMLSGEVIEEDWYITTAHPINKIYQLFSSIRLVLTSKIISIYPTYPYS